MTDENMNLVSETTDVAEDMAAEEVVAENVVSDETAAVTYDDEAEMKRYLENRRKK